MSLGLFFNNNSKEVIPNNIEITFDGHEGEHYFFTSNTGKAIQLSEHHNELLQDENFENGNYIGKKFIIKTESTLSDKSQNISPKIKVMAFL
ncbi:hypothetical protein ULMS_27940 [Patiriisocius marinistellae]|uniref:Uncharacterized protein n=2 Tax=Patiriisocius marinistellae TaxID=2494560 RepID=A0A5J4G372_9FLAO|nr:hypothetical protein ULMS_27940 [Patiriisocius marinistellae]